MRIKVLEKAVCYFEIEYDVPDKLIEADENLCDLVEKFKKGEELNNEEQLYLYDEVNSLGSVQGSEQLDTTEEFQFEEFQDYEEYEN